MNTLFGNLSGIFTALLILLFAGLVAWAWSSARRESFDASARLPLEEDQALKPANDGERQP
jgi:cytochrome c oxidase cbb3-type subunit 4